MAQNIKLKRSSVAGKVPTTSQLEAGELAINTVDGKLYFERDDSTIQSIVTTNALITGSLNINGPITGSSFKGDGIAITGVVTSSYALTASYAANVPETASYALEADKLDGQHGSYYLNATNINAGTIADAYLPNSISSDITGNAATATTASFASTAPFTGITGKPTLVSSSAQIDLSQATGTAANATSASHALTAISASYALTASSVEQLNQNVVINGNLQVFGTSSFTYVTSSQLDVDNSYISVNVFEPAERFGGLKVYDSGSLSHLATASLAWDSTRNHWVYQNASGSTYTGGMFLSGPRNTGSLGDEPALAKWFVPRSDGGDHLENSQIFSSGSTTVITGSLTTTGKVTIGTVDNHGADPDKFLAIVNGEVVYRTGAQVLSDIGGQTSGTFVQNSGAGGTARYIMRYADSNSATTSSIYEDTSGNIGVSKTVPNAKLDVNGNAIVSGSLTVTNGLITPGTAYFEFVDIGGAVDGNALVSSVTGASGSAIADGISNVSLISILAAGYEAMFVDYIIYDSTKSNKRAGSLRLNWNSSQVVLDETSTGDIGNTSGYVFTAAINGSNVQLIASNSTGQTMQIIYQYKLLYIV